MKTNKLLQTIIIIVGLLLSFALVFMAKSIEIVDGDLIFDFDWSCLFSISFWLLTISMAICLTFCYIGFYTIHRNKLIESEEFQEIVKTYNDKIDLKGNNFDEYVRLNNLDEKKRVYLAKMSKKLNKWKLALATISNEKLNGRKGMYIKRKISILETRMSVEFIENNILGLRVKYTKINANNFRKSNYENLGDARKDHSLEGIKITGQTAKKMITSTMLTTVLTIFVFNAIFMFKFNANFWMIMISTTFSGMLNAYWGILLAKKYYRSEYVLPLLNKTTIMEDYVIWNMNNPSTFKTYNQLLDEYYHKRLEEATNKIKEEYSQKLDAIQNQFNNIKNQT